MPADVPSREKATNVSAFRRSRWHAHHEPRDLAAFDCLEVLDQQAMMPRWPQAEIEKINVRCQARLRLAPRQQLFVIRQEPP
jgi:hypothetical protein